MRSKTMYAALFVLAALFLTAQVGLSQQKAAEPGKFSALIEAKTTLCYPLEMTFKRPAAAAKTNFPAVNFGHGQHASIACGECHHMWTGKGPVEACNSAGCHDTVTDRADAMSYFKAFHNKEAKMSCIGCHAKLNEERKEKGKPVLNITNCMTNICHGGAAKK
jgi:hypothetical protein